MKHLKLFENAEQIVWVVNVTWLDGGNQIEVFSNEQAAENYYIDFANRQKEYSFKRHKKEYTSDDWILTEEDAEEWFENDDIEYSVKIISKTIQDKYELLEEFEIRRKAKKYNL